MNLLFSNLLRSEAEQVIGEFFRADLAPFVGMKWVVGVGIKKHVFQSLHSKGKESFSGFLVVDVEQNPAQIKNQIFWTHLQFDLPNSR